MTNSILFYWLECAYKRIWKNDIHLFAWLVKALLCKDLLITIDCINYHKKHRVAGAELYVAVMY